LSDTPAGEGREAEYPDVARERRDAAEHRRRILAVARALFAAHGVEAVSMHQIAQAAGVGQGTLYRRYEHKGLLCMALLGDSIEQVRHEICAALAAGADSKPALALLDDLLSRIVAFNEENGPLLGAACQSGRGDPRGAWYLSPIYDWLHRTVASLLQRAAAGAELSPLDVDYAADAILAALDIDLYLFQRRVRGFTPERIVRGLRRLCHEGLCPRSGTPSSQG
jgi:AcrR family transcriptional regulator